MDSRVRTFRRALLAWVALAGMALMSAGPLALGHPAPDTDCVPAVTVEHDHAAHRLGQAPEPADEHCVACHLTRSARGAAAAEGLPQRAVVTAGTILHDNQTPRTFERRAGDTRGPPSLA